MSTMTESEREKMVFEAAKVTPADLAMYRSYSTPRLRLLAFFGDRIARRILALR